jgi:acetyl-CoA C-acetyltransferase
MPYVASIGTYLPCWGAPQHRVAGDDEDAITLAVEAGRAALIGSGAVERVVPVSRDGAAALVLAAEDVVDRFTDRPVWIRGVGLGLDSVMHQHKPDMTPADVAEVHDFFTGIELISYEDLGFAERFGGYKLVEAEVTSVGGALPVNPSGGLKAKGHPPGATGVAQCVELFAQLRGEAANQVDGAQVALAHNIGGPAAVSAVTILEGSANGAR